MGSKKNDGIKSVKGSKVKEVKQRKKESSDKSPQKLVVKPGAARPVVTLRQGELQMDDPSLYFNRELSWLEFNGRVLEEAQDKSNPVLERVKFLAITSSNLDEFFMVRVSSLMGSYEAGIKSRDISGMTAEEQLNAISEAVHILVWKQYNCLTRSVLPLLKKNGIELLSFKDLVNGQKEYVFDYFQQTVYPVLTPMAIDQSRPLPLIDNRSLNIIVEIEGDEEEKFAVIQAPAILPRCLRLPGELSGGKCQFILVEDIIKAYCHELFLGFSVTDSYVFRITRNSDLEIDEEDTDDLLSEIERSIRKRKWGDPVRIEIEKNMSAKHRRFLEQSLCVNARDIYEISGPLDLTFLFSISGLKGFDHLRNEPLLPVPPVEFLDKDIFEAIRERDILVHHPYQSFDCVINFVRQAAKDPRVMAIKQTLYRVSGDSLIVDALIRAAENGKHVTVLVELKARFDEENNIIWAKKLEKAGCHVIYGLVGLKTHCKICLVVRREDSGIMRYIHLGTGNYNDSTARIYTDLGLFTCKEAFGRDVSGLLNVLTGYSRVLNWNKLVVAPTTLRQTFTRLIDAERENAEAGLPAVIKAKINSLVDPGIIKALYRASMAGVVIELIVRGICCLKSGVSGVSDNIRVVSIVDRFLEHSRIFYFHNAGNPKVYLSSADWMPRNLDRRVEVAFPVEDTDLRRRLIDLLDITFTDTIKLRVQNPDGTYDRVDKRGKEPVHTQLLFYEKALEEYNEAMEMPVAERFTPVLRVMGGSSAYEEPISRDSGIDDDY